MDRKRRGLMELSAGFLCYATGFMILLPYAIALHRISVWPLPLISIVGGVLLMLMGVVDCSL